MSTVTSSFAKRIDEFFYEGLLAFVDCLAHLAFNDPEKMRLTYANVITPSKLIFATYNAKSQGVRLLVVLSNLTYTREVLLSRLCGKLADVIDVVPAKLDPVRETMTYMDNLIFETYTREKTAKICEVVERGILFPGVDWETMTKPAELRGYVHTLLLEMVFVHSEVHDTYKAFLGRILSEILTTAALKFLGCLQRVPKFGVGGTLRATLEVEFVHQTLLSFETRTSKEVFQRIYACIDVQGKLGQEAFKQEIVNIRDILKTARKSTEAQLLCLRESER